METEMEMKTAEDALALFREGVKFCMDCGLIVTAKDKEELRKKKPDCPICDDYLWWHLPYTESARREWDLTLRH